MYFHPHRKNNFQMIFQNQKLVPLKTFVEIPTIHFAIVWTLDLEWEKEKKVIYFKFWIFSMCYFFQEMRIKVLTVAGLSNSKVSNLES